MGRRAKDPALQRVIVNMERRGYVEGTKRQLDELFARLIVMPTHEVKRYATDKNAPVCVLQTACALTGGKGFAVLLSILDRLFGKPAEHIDHTTAGEALNPLAALTAEQLDTIIKALTDGNSDDSTPKQ